jgi:hypothetical protein
MNLGLGRDSVRRSPFAVRRSPFGGAGRTQVTVRRLAFLGIGSGYAGRARLEEPSGVLAKNHTTSNTERS